MSQSDNLNLAVSFKAREVKTSNFVASATIESAINQLSLTRQKIN